MDFSPWWLLLIPILFALGWMAARIDIHYLLRETRNLPATYSRGLLQMIDGKSDKAIDSFIDVLRQDPESVDLHFVLGQLFRRRGDMDEAIALHKSLLQSADLPLSLRQKTQYELGQDYLKAGLLDRAEEVFLSLYNTSFVVPALKALLDIYQRQRDWQRALRIAQDLENEGDVNLQTTMAHFYCELAQDEFTKNQPHQAMQWLQQAKRVNRGSVRGSLMMGDCWTFLKQPTQALEEWQGIEHQSVPHLGLVAERIWRTYQELGKEEEGIRLLGEYLDEYFSIDIVKFIFAYKVKVNSVEATTWLRNQLSVMPSLIGVDVLLQYQAETNDFFRDDLELYHRQIQQYIQALSRYKCTECGFKARQFYWQCPGCQNWDSISPIRTEELLLSR